MSTTPPSSDLTLPSAETILSGTPRTEFGFGTMLNKSAPPGPLPVSFTVASPPASAPATPAADPLEMVRKLFVGTQMDELKHQIQTLQTDVAKLRDSLEEKCASISARLVTIEDSKAHEELSIRVKDMETTLREDLSRVSQTAADALQAQSAALTGEIEQTRAHLVASVDERFRKLSASSVPRTHLAEILRDLSSRLQPAAG
jgi:uncharacterized small protein (DUF1192 family)